jgi:hypothetical protein
LNVIYSSTGHKDAATVQNISTILNPRDASGWRVGSAWPAIPKLRNPERISRCTKAAQHVAVLDARLGCGKRRQGEGCHARVHDGW